MPEKQCEIQGSRAGARRDVMLLIAAAAIPPAVLLLLRELDVPLGCPGRFVYLYSPSPVVAGRLAAVPVAFALAVAIGAAVWLLGNANRGKRGLGFALFVGGSLALGVWAYVAPPSYELQHAFNMQSPSQDGAFLREGFSFHSARDYLQSFPERAARPPELMRGTRVISNPPGATLLAYGCRRLVEATPPLERYLRRQFETPDADELRIFVDTASVGLLYTWVLNGAWLLSGVFLYRLGRLFFGPPGAAALCICVLFNPMTLLFTPGKDAAQLLTAAVALWLWFLAWRRKSAWVAMGAGAAFALAMVFSLVHVWLAVIALVAVIAVEAAKPWPVARSLFLPAVAGAAAICVLAYFTCGFNIPATLIAVARSQAAVTRGPDAMPWLWQSLGIPLFVLFAGPAVWAGGLSLARRRIRGGEVSRAEHRLGLFLLLSTLGVLAITVGFTNIETPRLWIPFLPPLLLGAALLWDALRCPDRRTRALLAVLVTAQIAGSALMWTLMDAREAEHRLLEGRLFW